MRKLVQADIDRILRRKALWIMVVAIFFIVMMAIFNRVFRAPDQGSGFAVAACDGISLVGLYVGFFLILNIYADDFKSMTFINVVGRGISRDKLILAKFIDCLVILFNMYVIAGLMTLFMKITTGTLLTPTQSKYLFLNSLANLLCITAAVMIAAFFFYMTENAVMGVIVYIICTIILPMVLKLVGLLPGLAGYHLERYYFYGFASAGITDFMIGDVLKGLGAMLGIVVIYIGGSLAATILLFRKKELDF